MLPTLEPVQTPWRRGAFKAMPHRLVFGQTYEDSRIELEAIATGSRVFCIAGAGFTARALAAAGHCVTAVDISAAQIDYGRAVNDGAPPRAGLAEGALGAGRRLAALCGWTRKKLDVFLNLSQCSEQVEYWDRELDTAMWRATVDALLAPRLLRFCYRGQLVAWLAPNFGPLIRQRLRRGWASHSNRSNPFAALLLRGEPIGCAEPPGLTINAVCADAAEFLEDCAPSSFDAFALSNLGDGAPPKYLERLAAAMARAGTARAIAVWRSFAEPANGMARNRAAADRSLIWGIVRACPIRELPGRILGDSGDGGWPCCIG
jgi:hypothetical protein